MTMLVRYLADNPSRDDVLSTARDMARVYRDHLHGSPSVVRVGSAGAVALVAGGSAHMVSGALEPIDGLRVEVDPGAPAHRVEVS